MAASRSPGRPAKSLGLRLKRVYSMLARPVPSSTLWAPATGVPARGYSRLASKNRMAQTHHASRFSSKGTLPMKRLVILALGSAVLAAPLYAALKTGAQAPDFTTQASLAGKPFKFALADALKKGPVVLYFYPAAFTPGCTVEAHEFAEATDKFKALGATVIGVSHDPSRRSINFP